MRIKDYFKVAELYNGHVTPGHYYTYENDPVGHGDHVHVAFLPWGEPDSYWSNPPPHTSGYETRALTAYRAAFEKKFGNRFGYAGGYYEKHRNSDPRQPFSQHSFANACDYMCNRYGADEIVRWLESTMEPPKPPEEDFMAMFDNKKELKDFMEAVVRSGLTGVDTDKDGLGVGQYRQAFEVIRGIYAIYNDGSNNAESAGRRFAEDMKKAAGS